MTLKISIIIPVYNVEQYLAECLDSVLRQTHKNLEIIIVDDGSPDNSCEIYNRYARQDSRIKIIKQSNGGLSAARNAGLEQASGDYIHFLDSDDHLVESDYYAKLLAAALSVNADIARSGFFYEFYLHTVGYSSRILTHIDEKMDLLKTRFTACPFLYKTSFLQKHRLKFDTALYGAEDLLFSVQAAYYARQIILVPETTYYYRNNTASISMTAAKDSTVARQQKLPLAWEKVRQFAESHYLGRGFEDFFLWGKRRVFKYKICNITFIKKVISFYKETYYLFGFLPIFSFAYVKNDLGLAQFLDKTNFTRFDRGLFDEDIGKFSLPQTSTFFQRF